jgi:hypothetical protein
MPSKYIVRVSVELLNPDRNPCLDSQNDAILRDIRDVEVSAVTDASLLRGKVTETVSSFCDWVLVTR